MILPDDQLEQILIESKAVPKEVLDEVMKTIKGSHNSLTSELISRGAITDSQLGQVLAQAAGVPFIDLSRQTIKPEVFNIVPSRLLRKYKVAAFDMTPTSIKLAMADPRVKQIPTMLEKKTGKKIEIYYATEKDIGTVSGLYKKVLQTTIDDLLKADIEKATHKVSDSLPIAKIVDTLIDAAYQDRSSDVHIEPEETTSLVRFRIDGVLQDVVRMPKALHDRIMTRIKVLSNLRTDEHLSAQDGKMRVDLEDERLDIRVSILPVTGGEKACLRILSSKAREYSLADLGFMPDDLVKIERAYKQSYGMILSTGPTGSGKTTTIYSILKILNTRDKNITTIEDPVEYNIKGANQIQVNVKTDLTFANGLRSILRQDPNIIFVGEIRDSETAGIAVNAALTGHLVLSTLHTNDAATAIPRLSDMGVEPFLVASTVRVIVAQRLLRKICDGCKTSIKMLREEVEKHFSSEIVKKYFGDDKELMFYQGQGCHLCHNTGYVGRLGVYEVLEVTKAIRKLITDNADSDQIEAQALKEGMSSMLDDGLIKVQKGLTTIDEVIRVTKVETL
jgi:type IV pilus assembly protein PilB